MSKSSSRSVTPGSLLLLLSLLAATPARVAAQPAELVTDRPDQTESAVTVPKGAWQLEAGWTWSRSDSGGLDTDTHEAPGTLLRVGLTQRLELRAGWSGYLREDTDGPGDGGRVEGFGDADLGFKTLLAEATAGRPQLALLVSTSLPIGEDEVSSDRFEPEVRLAMDRDLGERLGLGVNLGVGWAAHDQGGDTDTLASGLYTVALGIDLDDRWGVFVEAFGEEPLNAPGGHSAALDGGVTWLLRPTLQLDLAVGFGVAGEAPDAFVGAGLSWRWPQ